jgi:predicted permease
MTLVETLFPIFAIIGLGAVLVRTGYLDAAVMPPLGGVVIKVALPALIFLAVARTPPGETLDAGLLLAYAAGSLATLGICVALARWVLGLPMAQAAVIGLGVSMANSGFLGFPIAQALMGPETAARLLAHCMSVEVTLVLPLALVLIALGAEGAARAPLRRIVADTLRNPLLVALMAGLAVSASGLGLPPVGQAALDLLARLSAPLALLVIGGTLASLKVEGRPGAVVLMVVGKLGLHPLAVWAAAGMVPGLDPRLAAGAVLFAAMPMITIFPLLAARGGQGRLGAFGFLAATTLGLATLPLAIRLLGLV